MEATYEKKSTTPTRTRLKKTRQLRRDETMCTPGHGTYEKHTVWGEKKKGTTGRNASGSKRWLPGWLWLPVPGSRAGVCLRIPSSAHTDDVEQRPAHVSARPSSPTHGSHRSIHSIPSHPLSARRHASVPSRAFWHHLPCRRYRAPAGGRRPPRGHGGPLERRRRRWPPPSSRSWTSPMRSSASCTPSWMASSRTAPCAATATGATTTKWMAATTSTRRSPVRCTRAAGGAPSGTRSCTSCDTSSGGGDGRRQMRRWRRASGAAPGGQTARASRASHGGAAKAKAAAAAAKAAGFTSSSKSRSRIEKAMSSFLAMAETHKTEALCF